MFSQPCFLNPLFGEKAQLKYWQSQNQAPGAGSPLKLGD